jgi:hypothetical protein
MRDVFIGDKVGTPDGVGYVEDVVTWRDRILTMLDVEAQEFSAECRRTHGQNYQDEWCLVTVKFGRVSRAYDARQIVTLEGRDNV